MMKFLRTQMKWIMALIVIAFLLSTFFMYEGRTTRRTPGRNADGSMSDYEVAQINGRSLMRSELEQRLRNYLSNYGSRSAESLDMPAIYKAVLDEAVLESQLTKELDESGIRVSDAEAEQAMKDYADRYYATRETFYQALANSGIKVDDYKRQLARQIATEQLFRNAIGEVVISEDQAAQFYDTMKTLIYSKPEGFMVHMSDFNNNEAAEGFRAKLLAGESWDVIVSSDVLASKDLINITRAPVFLPVSAMQSGTLSVMASVDVGQPSEVFSVSSSDFAVGLKTSHVDASVSPYEEVSADIKNMLTNQEQRKRLSDYEASLRNKAQLVINDQELFTSPAVSVDETPSIIPEPTIEIIEESEDVKLEEAKPEEPATEATTAEEPKPEETSTEENKPEETVTEAVKPEEASTEEAKIEETPAEETKPEATEEVKVEETATEEAKPEETVTEDVKPEEPTTEEVKPEETPAEETKPEETPAVEAEIITQSQDIPLQEEITEITTEAVSEEKTAE